jgi:hypothetical protein
MKSIDVKRVEIKYFVREADVPAIIAALSVVMFLDNNCCDYKPYRLSSLYFDDVTDIDLREKLNGVSHRKKYRLRFYDEDLKKGKFEVKRKAGSTISKSSIPVYGNQVAQIIAGNYSGLFGKGYDAEIKSLELGNYRPKCIVSYDRLAFYLPYNQIRVTLDLNLCTHGHSFSLTHHLQKGILLCPKGHQILELKFAESMPRAILDELSKFPLVRTAISKYATSRLFSVEAYGNDLPYFAS